MLRRDPTDAAAAEDAYQTAIVVAQEQGARTYELLAALSLAKFYQSTGRPVEAHAFLGDALEGFAPTPEMPEIAEAQALLAALAETDDVKAGVAARQRRLKLQTDCGQAVMWAKGFAAEETQAAFRPARELASGLADNGGAVDKRLETTYAEWIGALVRGEVARSLGPLEVYRAEADRSGLPIAVAVAFRCLGVTQLFKGDFRDAIASLGRAIDLFEAIRSPESGVQFGLQVGISSAAYLAVPACVVGDLGKAGTLCSNAIGSASKLGHVPTLIFAGFLKALVDVVRGDASAAKQAAQTVCDLCEQHGLGQYLRWGTLALLWARARESGDRQETSAFRDALAEYERLGATLLAPLFSARLAELDAEGDEPAVALETLDRALALSKESGEGWIDSLLHRVRGDALMKGETTSVASAEDAYRGALSVARDQGARSFGLQAAVALAKLLQSTGRTFEARTALCDALAGFAPTLEMPEIAEAQALIERLA